MKAPHWPTFAALAALEDAEARHRAAAPFEPIGADDCALLMANRFAAVVSALDPTGERRDVTDAMVAATVKVYRLVEHALSHPWGREPETLSSTPNIPGESLAALVEHAIGRATRCEAVARPATEPDGTMTVRVSSLHCRDVADLSVAPWHIVAHLAREPATMHSPNMLTPTLGMLMAPIVASGAVRRLVSTDAPTTLYARELEVVIARECQRVFGAAADVRIERPPPTHTGEDPFTTQVFAPSGGIVPHCPTFHLVATARELLRAMERLPFMPPGDAAERRRQCTDRIAELLELGAVARVSLP